MILEIQHETLLEYSGPITEGFTEVRMEPVSDADQSCRSFNIRTVPTVPTYRYQDGLGNRVHHFDILQPHQHVSIVAASVVETHPRAVSLADCPARYPLAAEALPLDALDSLAFGGPIRPTPLLSPVLDELRPSNGANIGGIVAAVSRYVHERFEYAQYVTQASSPIDDVLRQGKGVCQDFAHLMIGVLRAFGLPARYVSGYIHRPGSESQSHAWVEAWLPPLGWVGIDPTNDCRTTENFVKVASGRDFTDVPPNKGVYRGLSTQAISVRVETRELVRLPPLTWQEQLPALQVPLRTIVPAAAPPCPNPLQIEQQQQ